MKRFLIFLSLIMLGFACSPCSGLRQTDNAIDTSFESLRAQYMAGGLTEEGYIFELRKLREKEEEMLDKAASCEFRNQQEYNYWHRSRLKFPSRIQQELERLGGA